MEYGREVIVPASRRGRSGVIERERERERGGGREGRVVGGGGGG